MKLQLNTLELQAGDVVTILSGAQVRLTGEPIIYQGTWGDVRLWADCPIIEGDHPLGFGERTWDVQGNANAIWTVERQS